MVLGTYPLFHTRENQIRSAQHLHHSSLLQKVRKITNKTSDYTGSERGFFGKGEDYRDTSSYLDRKRVLIKSKQGWMGLK